MDTRFWGPSGWKMLHLITFTYEPSNAKNMDKFLETLPYILPCKFCRSSLTDYYKEHPYTPHLHSKQALIKWMYTIHNCVNDKLRKQGLNPNKDPSLSEVKKYYASWIESCPMINKLTVFWDFLFSVAYNHPKESSRGSKPMPNCPQEAYTCKHECERNKWNVLTVQERMKWYSKFWELLPAVLPTEISHVWQQKQKEEPCLECRRSTVAWLWRTRCAIDPEFKDPYTEICKKVSSYSSECSKSVRSRTCRKKKK